MATLLTLLDTRAGRPRFSALAEKLRRDYRSFPESGQDRRNAATIEKLQRTHTNRAVRSHRLTD